MPVPLPMNLQIKYSAEHLWGDAYSKRKLQFLGVLSQQQLLKQSSGAEGAPAADGLELQKGSLFHFLHSWCKQDTHT